MIGRTISRYRIVEKIGEGGMGEVYRARDARLDRDVAIKVLPEAVARNPDRLTRFEREAKAVARLSHPNILEIFDFGRENEVTFAVTELLRGETLRERLEGGTLDWRRTAEVGVCIAAGLAAAHEAGVVHRDLKPSNIFLTHDGRVKILDFGLARSVVAPAAGDTQSPTVSSYTDPGSVLGTVGYMSPEQVRGVPADHRSDIFSLGCVLYEMITARRAFASDTAAETMTAILREEPSNLRTLAPDLPPGFADAVRRCLEKRPEDRYPSARDLGRALKDISDAETTGARAQTASERSIVVLPFKDISPAGDTEYFSDGLIEEIIADLSQVPGIHVISGNSAMRLKGTKKTVKEIGSQLNVRYVLEGSVRKAGNDLRITAQLIDTRDERQLWAEKYSGTLDDVFDIQEKVSRAIVDALELKLTPQAGKRMAERPIQDVRAYEYYLKAHQEWNRGTENALDRALQLLSKGLEISGENAILYAGMGLVYANYVEMGLRTWDPTVKKAQEVADRVMTLAPHSASSDQLLGRLERLRGSVTKAIRYFERALTKDPRNPETLMWLGWHYTLFAGMPSAVDRLMKTLIEIDPLSAINHVPLAWSHFMRGRLDRSITLLRKLMELQPEFRWCRFFCALLLARNEQREDALELVEYTVMHDPNDLVSTLCIFFKHALQGEKARAFQTLTEELRFRAWHDPELPWVMASCFALLDEREDALSWLERAVARGWINFPLFSEVDPFLQNIRGEERFEKLMVRVRHEWEDFEPRLPN